MRFWSIKTRILRYSKKGEIHIKLRYIAIATFSFWILVMHSYDKLCTPAFAEQEKTLYVSGSNQADEVDLYFSNKDVKIDTNCLYADATDVQRIILSKASTPDVFILDVDEGFYALKQKGYLETVPLTSFIDEVKFFYPAIQNVVTNDNKQVIAVPEQFIPIHWCVNETLWKQIFGNKDYPETFLDLAELIEFWNDNMADIYPDFKLLEFSGNSKALLIDVVKQYIFQCESSNQSISFSNQTFIQTLEKIRDLNISEITESMEDVYFNQEPLLLMQPIGGFSVEYMDGYRYIPILPPKLEHTSPAYVPARMRIMIVNPFSQNKELAYEYISYCWNSQNAKIKACLIENWETPVCSEAGVEALSKVEKEIEETRNLLNDAITQEEFEKEDLYGEKIFALNEKREKILKKAFEVSSEDIEEYHSIGPYVNLLLGSSYAHDDDPAMQSIMKIIDQFADGKMTGTTCAIKLDEITRMIFMETDF